MLNLHPKFLQPLSQLPHTACPKDHSIPLAQLFTCALCTWPSLDQLPFLQVSLQETGKLQFVNTFLLLGELLGSVLLMSVGISSFVALLEGWVWVKKMEADIRHKLMVGGFFRLVQGAISEFPGDENKMLVLSAGLKLIDYGWRSGYGWSLLEVGFERMRI